MTYPAVEVSPSSEAAYRLNSTMNCFEELVWSLKNALGESSGLTSDDVDVDVLSTWMERYVSNEKEWVQYAMADSSRGYTRNLVDEGNGKSNLLVLVWTPGKGSPIHDRPLKSPISAKTSEIPSLVTVLTNGTDADGNAHCLMKILRGRLTETRFDFPDSNEQGPMKVKSERVHEENAVAYMADELGVHRVSNQGSDFAVSLHLYTPPNVAKGGCFIFNQNTGKKTHVAKCGYYSAYGRRLKED